MKSHFFIILIFLRGWTESEVAQLRHWAPTLRAIHFSCSSCLSVFTISRFLLVFFHYYRQIILYEPHFQCLAVSNTSSTSVLCACPFGLSLLFSCIFFSSSPPSLVSTLIVPSTWNFFLWWPCSQAAGLYLVRPMIKSAGLTSAWDRPIHPTDTPPPPHREAE